MEVKVRCGEGKAIGVVPHRQLHQSFLASGDPYQSSCQAQSQRPQDANISKLPYVARPNNAKKQVVANIVPSLTVPFHHMPVRTKASGHQKRVAFRWKKMSNIQRPPLTPQPGPDSETVDEEIFIDSRNLGLMIPDLFTEFSPVRDVLATATSRVQDETVELCLPFMSGEDELSEYNKYGVPHLDRARHIRFLHQCLGKLPGRFVAADASRPWFLYWCLSALTMLGEDVSSYRESIAATARSMQNESGGFGGGGQQLSHMATTYAVVLALALVGGDDVFEVVDRKAMWRWLCTLKQPDGGFQVCLGGEEDIRFVNV